MIDGHKISVLIPTYRRFTNLHRICMGWLQNPVDEVWVVDNSGSVFVDIPGHNGRFTVFNMPKDFATKTDMALAPLTEGDFIIFADDDVLPKIHFAEELYAGWRQCGGGMVGIIGRTFEGEDYYKQTTYYSSLKISKPVEVGFVGVVQFVPREYIGFDLRGMPKNADDFWLCMVKHPKVKKYVVPTKQFENLPEASDAGAMFHNPVLKAERNAFYGKWYREHYARR